MQNKNLYGSQNSEAPQDNLDDWFISSTSILHCPGLVGYHDFSVEP
jgi:hypothetical protein